MDTTEIKIIYDTSKDKMVTTEIKINSDHLQTIQEDKMFELEEKSLPCQEDNDSKPDENDTISENDEDTISENDFMDLRRRCVELDVMLML